MTTFDLSFGTAKTWLNTGGSGVITLASLANGAGRQGDRVDLGANPARRHLLRFRGKATSSPTAGLTISVLLGWCPDTSYQPGELGSADAAYSDTDLFGQLDEYVIPWNNSTNSQSRAWIVETKARYLIPAVFNRLGVSFGSTASDFQIDFVPISDYTA